MRKRLALLVLLLAAGGAVWRFGFRAKAPESPAGKIETAKVERGPLRVTIEATGRIVPHLEVEIKCKASGTVSALPFDISDTVKKGELLLELDPVDEKRNLQKARVALAVSEARLAQAKVDLEVAQRNLATETERADAALPSSQAATEEALARLDRVEQLLAKKLASPEERDGARSRAAQAKSELAAAQARVEDLQTQAAALEGRRQSVLIAERQVEADRITVSDAEQRLADTRILSPLDGVVAGRLVQPGAIISSGISNVGGGTTVLTLHDLSRLFVLAAVDETDIGRVALDQAVEITADAFPGRPFAGKVVRIAPKGANVSNVVTFEVKIEVEDPRRGLLRPEMTANLTLLVAEKTGVLRVPVEAVTRRKGKASVRVQAGGRTEERQVETGATDQVLTEIVGGLEEGEVVEIRRGAADGKWQGQNSPRPPTFFGGPPRR